MNDQKHEEREQQNTVRSLLSRRTLLKRTGVAAGATGAVVATASTRALAQDGTPTAAGTPSGTMTDHGAMVERPAAFFVWTESQTVEALTARIIPGTPDDPGAREAGVVFYIDQALAGTNLGYDLKTYTDGPFPVVEEEPTAVEATSQLDNYRAVPVDQPNISRYGYQSVLTPQEIYRRGIVFVNAYANDQFGSDFVDLEEADQDTIVAAMADDSATGFDGPSARAFFTQLRNDTIEGMFADPMYGGNKDMVGWKMIGYPGAQRFYTTDDIVDPNFSREPQSLGQMMANEGR